MHVLSINGTAGWSQTQTPKQKYFTAKEQNGFES
jgi:hypothetical protein